MQGALLHDVIPAAHTSYASMRRKEDLVFVVIVCTDSKSPSYLHCDLRIPETHASVVVQNCVWADSKSHSYLHCNLGSGQDGLHMACCPAFAAMTARATHTVCQPATTQCTFGN